jgi:hypothetical protein
VNQQVQSAVARGLAGNPCAGLRHLCVNMETMSQQAYPEGWFGRVAASLQLTAEQRSVLKAAWGKIVVDRAALLARHEVLTQQLTQMQQQQAAVQQEFGARMIKANERCVTSMQKQARQSMHCLMAPSTAAATAAAMGGVRVAASQVASLPCSISSGSGNNRNLGQSQAGAAQIYRSTTPVGGCNSSSCSTFSTASAAAAAAAFGNCTAAVAMPGVISLLLQQQQPNFIRTIRPAPLSATAANSKALSMTCDVQGPVAAAAAAAAADTSALASHPEVLMCAPPPGQAALQGKLSGVRASLGLLYSWAGLLAYNTLSRKQLAVAAVTSYPFAFDPVAGEGAGCTASCRGGYTVGVRRSGS